KLVSSDSSGGIQVALQSSGRQVVYRAECVEDCLGQCAFRLSGATEQAKDCSSRIADIAHTTRLFGICFVAEVAHESGHAALARCGEAQNFFKLLGAMLRLDRVRFLPARCTNGDIAREVYVCAAVDFEFLE